MNDHAIEQHEDEISGAQGKEHFMHKGHEHRTKDDKAHEEDPLRIGVDGSLNQDLNGETIGVPFPCLDDLMGIHEAEGVEEDTESPDSYQEPLALRHRCPHEQD